MSAEIGYRKEPRASKAVSFLLLLLFFGPATLIGVKTFRPQIEPRSLLIEVIEEPEEYRNRYDVSVYLESELPPASTRRRWKSLGFLECNNTQMRASLTLRQALEACLSKMAQEAANSGGQVLVMKMADQNIAAPTGKSYLENVTFEIARVFTNKGKDKKHPQGRYRIEHLVSGQTNLFQISAQIFRR